MENINMWREMEATLEADNVTRAENSNLNDDSRRSRLTLPPLIVYSGLILRQLMLISMFTIIFNVIQLICQAYLLFRSKRLMISLLNSCAVCWTFLIVILTIKWLIVLQRNRTEILYRGKMMVISCQLLSMLNLISTFMAFCLEAIENSTALWSLPLVKELPYFLSRTINDIKWLMGSMICCNCLNIVLFIIVLFYVKKGRSQINHVLATWLWRAIYQHIQNNAAQPAANISGNALVSDYILSTFNRNPNQFLSKDLEFSAAAA